MNRHLLAGRYGAGDTATIPQATDEILTPLPLVSGNKTLNFGLQTAIRDLEKLCVYPSEIGIDLLIVAAHVYAADTRIARKTESQDGWTREIRLVVPVKDVELWNSAAWLLSDMLNFLTGDKWTVGFRPRPKGFQKIAPKNLSDLLGTKYDGVSLFSGGLDSLIGAIDSLENEENVLLVSHAAEGAVSDAQNTIFAALNGEYGENEFDRLRFWFNIPKNQFQGLDSEDSTRGRSFLFFSLGVFAGSGLGQHFTLKVPENGLIALNVPLDPLRLGSNSTRTTHPYYMARWNDLISALGIDGQIVNPYWNKTKGEMIAACSNRDFLESVLPLSMSCSSPTKGRWQGKGVEDRKSVVVGKECRSRWSPYH